MNCPADIAAVTAALLDRATDVAEVSTPLPETSTYPEADVSACASPVTGRYVDESNTKNSKRDAIPGVNLLIIVPLAWTYIVRDLSLVGHYHPH